MNSENINIVWVRNDLRIKDNPALFDAAKSGRIVAIYIWAPHEEDKAPGSASKVWLYYALRSFEKDLSKFGVQLLYSVGDSIDVLSLLIDKTKAKGLYWNHRYEPKIFKRDQEIKRKLSNDLQVHCFNGNYFLDPNHLRNKSDSPFKVFTPFWRECLSRIGKNNVVPVPEKLEGIKEKIHFNDFGDFSLLEKSNWEKKVAGNWDISENAADKILDSFIERDHNNYDVDRNIPAIDGTSTLSPYLHFGKISPNYILKKIKKTSQNSWRKSQFLTEIGWREFASHLLFHYPQTINEPLRHEFQHFPWQTNESAYGRWAKGLTGYPFVDAGMRQLWQTGWMHNRVRMVVSSFLVKHLLIDWRTGVEWFWDTLVDADLASNTFGWQWVAGCGADAAPYFRIFNPILQSKKFDTKGLYIKKWVKELSHIDDASVHLPEMGNDLFDASVRYPEPIVSHQSARINALEAYRSIKSGECGILAKSA